MIKRIMFLRSGYDNMPDPRLEKEVISLHDAGYKVKVIAWDRSKNEDSIITVNVGNIKVKYYLIGIKGEYGLGMSSTLRGMIAFNRKLLIFLIKHRKTYDYIHACEFDTVIPAYIVSKMHRKILVYDIFDYYADSHFMPDKVAKLIRCVDTYIINRTDATIICNEARRKQILPANPRRIAVIHNTPNFDTKVLEGKHDGEKNTEDSQIISIAYVGRLESKGRFLKEIVDIISEDKRFVLHIGGGGPLEEYVKKKSEISPGIKFYGNMNYDDVIGLENKCDVMTAIYDPILKNHRYAAPNKFYEALMLGKPLIVMENTGVDVEVLKNHIGWVVKDDGEFSREFNTILCQVYENRSKLIQYRDTMKSLYMTNYKWEVMSRKLIDLYNQLG